MLMRKDEVDCLLVTVAEIFVHRVQVVRSFVKLHSRSNASIKQQQFIYKMPACQSI